MFILEEIAGDIALGEQSGSSPPSLSLPLVVHLWVDSPTAGHILLHPTTFVVLSGEAAPGRQP